MHALARFIQDEMTERRLNPSTLAARAGLPRQTIYNWLRDEREFMEQTPQRRTLQAIAQALNIPESRILAVAAQAIGADMGASPNHTDASTLSNEEIALEVARRFGVGTTGANANRGSATKVEAVQTVQPPIAPEVREHQDLEDHFG